MVEMEEEAATAMVVDEAEMDADLGMVAAEQQEELVKKKDTFSYRQWYIIRHVYPTHGYWSL